MWTGHFRTEIDNEYNTCTSRRKNSLAWNISCNLFWMENCQNTTGWFEHVNICGKIWMQTAMSLSPRQEHAEINFQSTGVLLLSSCSGCSLKMCWLNSYCRQRILVPRNSYTTPVALHSSRSGMFFVHVLALFLKTVICSSIVIQ